MLAKLLTTMGLVATGLLLILMTTTTPSSIGAAGILAIFLLGYVFLLCLLTFVLWLATRLIGRAGKELHIIRKSTTISLRKSYYYSSVVSLGPIILVSLQSVGGVSFYDFALVLLFIFLGCVYVARRTI